MVALVSSVLLVFMFSCPCYGVKRAQQDDLLFNRLNEKLEKDFSMQREAYIDKQMSNFVNKYPRVKNKSLQVNKDAKVSKATH
ncbi:MAG: hypothetical protein HRU19_07045 [Pseudobacteriovorax sp.]|nr:hypothetical protein [Pseudobacteriovorax sp.]